MNLANISPKEARGQFRLSGLVRPTAGIANGYVQANLVVLEKSLAYDFLLFCQRNPKPCPVLEVTDVGNPEPKRLAPAADLRTDLPKYRIYRQGEWVDETTDIKELWEPDMVAFLLGCSFTFENALQNNGISVRHIEENCNVPMYKTNILCEESGIFHGPMVVSMRPIPEGQVVRAVEVTSRFPSVHGAPVHIGRPELIGIKDLDSPDFGDAVTVKDGEVPVFWACGVTPQAVAMAANPDFMITHAPGHMFITDLRDEIFSV